MPSPGSPSCPIISLDGHVANDPRAVCSGCDRIAAARRPAAGRGRRGAVMNERMRNAMESLATRGEVRGAARVLAEIDERLGGVSRSGGRARSGWRSWRGRAGPGGGHPPWLAPGATAQLSRSLPPRPRSPRSRSPSIPARSTTPTGRSTSRLTRPRAAAGRCATPSIRCAVASRSAMTAPSSRPNGSSPSGFRSPTPMLA